MIVAYLDGSYESFNIVRQLEDREIPYEAKNQADAHEFGFYNLPILIVGNKVMEYKKALRWLKRQKGGVKW